jgi:DnaJ-class molecular chaperone
MENGFEIDECGACDGTGMVSPESHDECKCGMEEAKCKVCNGSGYSPKVRT